MTDAKAALPDLPPVLYLIHCQQNDNGQRYAGVQVSATSPTNDPWRSWTNSEGDVVNPGTGLAGVTLGKGHYSVDFTYNGKLVGHREWDLAWPPDAPILVGLDRVAPALPAPPARLDVCGLQVTIAGLTYRTQEWGTFPAWFYPKLNAADRPGARDVHRGARDTHMTIPISEAYIEPSTKFPRELSYGYDYAYDLPRLRELVTETVADGFLIDMPLAGDGLSKSEHPAQGEYNDPQGNTYGYQWLMDNLERILLGLKGDGTPAAPDLTRYILFRPGWDSVFYGWGIPGEVPDRQPERVMAFARKFREVLPDGYLAIEHTPGNIPCGEGDADFLPGGRMQDYDALLGEFNTYHEDSYWQIAGRMLDPYHRPADQVGDSLTPPKYLHASARGPRVYIVFEPTRPGAYTWVRSECTVEDIAREDRYARDTGARYTGYSPGRPA